MRIRGKERENYSIYSSLAGRSVRLRGAIHTPLEKKKVGEKKELS